MAAEIQMAVSVCFLFDFLIATFRSYYHNKVLLCCIFHRSLST